MHNSTQHIDVCLVGGGLQSCVVALALRAAQPSVRILIVERGGELCGNHTWCFHDHDAAAAGGSQAVLASITEHRWPAYDVHFTNHSRTLHTGYNLISSTKLRNVVMAAQDSTLHIRTGCNVTQVAKDHIMIGEHRVEATVVMDNRGGGDEFAKQCGYQKFVGHEVECTAPHGVERPILMDATVDQRLGYRFFYVLPLSPTRLLIEDTYYSDDSVLDVAMVREEIAAYSQRAKFPAYHIEREETGILPLPWAATGPHVSATEALRGGYRGGWFHPVTGYSFPLAWRLAAKLAAVPVAAWRTTMQVEALRVAHQQPLALRLNWMLFRWFAPQQRHHVLARFYRLPVDTIARFYALDTTLADRVRLFVGRPPRGMSWRAFWLGAV